jgi:hypothetical protein
MHSEVISKYFCGFGHQKVFGDDLLPIFVPSVGPAKDGTQSTSGKYMTIQ